MAEHPKGQSCANCRYAEDAETDSVLPICCVRYPPIRVSTEDRAGFWPRVESSDWCGEWAPENPETLDEGAAIMARYVLLGDLTAARALADKLRE